VLFFEHDAASGGYAEPEAYPRHAVAVAGSHDLPTIRGWWEGFDIDLKERLGQYPGAEQAESARKQRQSDREKLLIALRKEHLIAQAEPAHVEDIAVAVHRYLARSNTFLAMAQLDDISWEPEPVNMPGTCTEYPNWRRRLGLSLEDLAANPLFQKFTQLFHEERGGARGGQA
jgi:4-alpha-glucanotransferase